MPWLSFVLDPFPELFRPVGPSGPFKGKDGFFRRAFTERQIQVAYEYLTRTDYDIVGGMLGAVTYGGKVNTVAADATASPQRDSILSTACMAGWGAPEQESDALAWLRAFYRDLYAETGGVPAPSERCDGCMINHPDTDLADPRWNTSGVPWHRFYFKDNYPRLQRVKARWDPRDVFRHALSIRAE
jgi:aclacinomycin oxidase